MGERPDLGPRKKLGGEAGSAGGLKIYLVTIAFVIERYIFAL
jgi:hypothetical protein